MILSDYLARIKYTGELNPTLETLACLQKQHLFHVPFENLDIHHGTPINLNLEKLYQKIVYNKRGGFCYELNGLFCEFLNALGFQVRMLSARVFNSASSYYGPEFDHMALLVNLNQEEYLIDVGFGDFAFAPLKLELNTNQTDQNGTYNITQYENGYLRVSRVYDAEQVPKYIFKKDAQPLEAFSTMCHYHQSSPESHFTQKALITKPTTEGRVTLTGNTLKLAERDNTTEKQLIHPAAYTKALEDYFQVSLKTQLY